MIRILLAFLLVGCATSRPALDIPAAASSPASRTPERTERPVLAIGSLVVVPSAAPSQSVQSVTGLATWYCLAGRSACTRGHPDGMYAAAGPALRRFLGPDWRGQRVTVTAGGRSVTVTLIDWCRCPGGRVVDLYADAFAQLAPLSRGVLPVNILTLGY